MSDSPDLLRRILHSERSVFDEIVTAYADELLRSCTLLLRDREEARDVLQEAMLRLVRVVRAGKFRSSNGSIKGFLCTAARNLCIDRLRKRIDFRALDDDGVHAHPALSDTDTPDRALDEARFTSAFDEALTRLTHAQRAVLVLHELHGEPQNDIATSLGLSIDCVRTHLYRARKRMRTLMARFIGES